MEQRESGDLVLVWELLGDGVSETETVGSDSSSERPAVVLSSLPVPVLVECTLPVGASVTAPLDVSPIRVRVAAAASASSSKRNCLGAC